MTVEAHARPKIFRISFTSTLTERRYKSSLSCPVEAIAQPKIFHFSSASTLTERRYKSFLRPPKNYHFR